MTPTKNAPRVLRGGGWSFYGHVPSWVRAASRIAHGPAYRYGFIGFRTALAGRTPR